MIFDPADHPHGRYDPLGDRWTLVSPHRAKRPWQGQDDPALQPAIPSHDPDCYLCPGNARITGEHNPVYRSVYVFANDFAAVGKNDPAPPEGNDLFRARPAQGTARVICFSPDHGRTLPELSQQAVESVVACWCDLAAELGAGHAHVQIFENKGAMMGCSNPHPHGQVWATAHVPDTVVTECRTQADWLARTGTPLLLELAGREAGGPRMVAHNADWIALVPWWAQWPFETLLLPRFAAARLTDLEPEQRRSLAEILRELTARYDNLFECSFPYSMGWHGAPTDGAAYPGFQLHAHFYPPLLRSATIRKFMVGYEMLAEPQRDLTPEQAAERLRAVPSVHYRG